MAAPAIDRPTTKAKVKFVRMSASKARVVLNLIRGKRVADALEILEFTERLAADPITKCLNSAIANAEHNDDLSADDLFVSACFADQGPTLRRYRPRARGRAGRIQKQTCHLTIEVSRLTDDEIDELRRQASLKDEGRQSRKKSSGGGGDRAKRVAKSKAATDEAPEAEDVADEVEDQVEDVVEEATDQVDEVTEEATQAADEAAAAEEVAETTDESSADAEEATEDKDDA